MDALFATFKARAEAVSAEVHRFPDKDHALGFIAQFLRNEAVADAPNSYALWADSRYLSPDDKQHLRARVPGLRFEVTRELAASAKVGISQMDWGIANTGTIVQDASAVEKRLVSTLPIIHMALVGTGTLFPDLPALLRQTNPRSTAYISMITGPSRTADIERVLTIGVHGPERLIIVVVDDLKGMAS